MVFTQSFRYTLNKSLIGHLFFLTSDFWRRLSFFFCLALFFDGIYSSGHGCDIIGNINMVFI